jgi:hypothetical protein
LPHPANVSPGTPISRLALCTPRPAGNWLCSARSGTPPNWLCFVEFAPVTVPSLVRPAPCVPAGPGRIGFVRRISLHGWYKQPCRPRALAIRAEIGFVSPRLLASRTCHNSSSIKYLPFIGSWRNWVCLAQSPLVPPAPPGIGFVSHVHLASNLTLHTSNSPRIGFVCTALFQPTTDYRPPATAFRLCLTRSTRSQEIRAAGGSPRLRPEPGDFEPRRSHRGLRPQPKPVSHRFRRFTQIKEKAKGRRQETTDSVGPGSLYFFPSESAKIGAICGFSNFFTSGSLQHIPSKSSPKKQDVTIL